MSKQQRTTLEIDSNVSVQHLTNVLRTAGLEVRANVHGIPTIRSRRTITKRAPRCWPDGRAKAAVEGEA
ncbi:hypothetical protein [Marichromatium purpuratum]|uniref:hypothetical protein n=1 Tax=Marichromatium purpuratum TaxID=37487 RepID=UPI00021E6193|nr:hypothetical protein [Marichromatium purpuratum]